VTSPRRDGEKKNQVMRSPESSELSVARGQDLNAFAIQQDLSLLFRRAERLAARLETKTSKISCEWQSSSATCIC